ncbi:iron-containing alcohol dehydrogenase [Noviherbaspirillum sedimenti]|uniref:Iron-containing alcohol dehydrogenase n=1 Tax=Noviherbaspirillum sedimenti TaxID=2320865 RepID=A0A3A3G0I8_9BURK|nr:iron-containing alcohol dehydrogenase [Noviherbaspirillum sedimenti]RJG01434.1 iron-containing alcohol dehydrogenase [Noviherbaspirillum sedimenti]
MSQFIFETAPKIVCEQGAANQLGQLSRQLGVTHLFIVTDRFLHESGMLAGALASLAEAGIQATVFSDVQADPPETSVQAAVEFARSTGVDGVVGFGGGSSMDTAKLVALLVKTPQALPDIYGVGLARGPRLPLVQVPTTAGTGSEVTAISILTTPANEKKGVVSSLLYPDVALLDSLLTLGLPPRMTAMTGVDAMVHAIEAYTSRHNKNPLSDSLAVRALTLLYNNIRTVIRDGKDAGAREAMLLGSLFAGMAFANAPVAAVHALAYPLGGHYHLPHGLSNALVLVPVLEFNREAAAPLYAELARAILPERSFSDDLQATDAFIEAIRALVSEMPFEQNLKSAGVPEGDLEMLAKDAMNVQRLLVNNPRDVSYDDALAIYRAVY